MGKDPFPSYIDEMLQKRFNKGSLTNLVMCENGIPQLTVVNACYYDNENYHLYVVTYKGNDVKKTISDGDFLVCGLENTEDTVTYLSRIFFYYI